MFAANALRTLVTKPALANSALKSTLFASKAPFQAALLQRSFSRHFDKTNTNNVPPYTGEKAGETFKPIPPTGPNVDQIIREDINLNKFMTKIYTTTGLSIVGFLGVSSALAVSTASIAMSPFITMFGGLAISIGGIIAMNRIPPQLVIEKGTKGQVVEKLVNPFSRKVAFSSIIAGSGIMVSPFMQGLILTNPAIIPMAAGLSIMTMGGSSLYAMYKPLGQFRTWEATLYSGLIGLIGMNVASMITFAVIGPNVFSLACGKIDMYLGLALFTAFQAMDTQMAVQAYKDGNHDHLIHVVNFFLNFKNIFIRIASILGGNFRDD